jgi:hypothetical protein
MIRPLPPRGRRSTAQRSSAWAAIVTAIAVVAALAGGVTSAQDAPPANWPKVEASEDFKKFLDQAKKGEFDASSRAFLERMALPQLGVEGNRKQIERVRRRMREMLLNGRTIEPAAFDQIARAAVDALTAQARNPQVEPVVAINAMLLVGEIRGKDDRPWAGAAQPLAAAMADAKLPLAVRVAAAAGLAKQVDASRTAAAPDPGLMQAAAKPVQAVVAAPVSTADAAAGNWLVARALDMLPAVAPKATPESAAALQGILNDASRPIDIRVRAAAALGATAAPGATIDAGAAIATVHRLAIEALEADVATAAERVMKARLSGQPMMPMGGRGYEGGAAPAMGGSAFGGEFGGAAAAPAEELPIDALVVRRDAWRLMTLANAVSSGDGSTGLVSLATGDAVARGQTLAQTLRDSATALDQSPDATVVKQALTDLERLGRVAAPAAAGTPAAAGQPAADKPVANDPFGTGN